MSQRIGYRGPRPKAHPPRYQHEAIDRNEAVDFMIDLAGRLGDDVRLEGPIPAGVGYDARMPVEHLGRYYTRAWDHGYEAAVKALTEIPASLFLSGRDSVICALLERFQRHDPIA